jgi:hypothetical protein
MGCPCCCLYPPWYPSSHPYRPPLDPLSLDRVPLLTASNPTSACSPLACPLSNCLLPTAAVCLLSDCPPAAYLLSAYHPPVVCLLSACCLPAVCMLSASMLPAALLYCHCRVASAFILPLATGRESHSCFRVTSASVTYQSSLLIFLFFHLKIMDVPTVAV